jgi:hypothetical protein
VRTDFTQQDTGPSPHPCNAPGLSATEFLRAVYNDPTLPMSTRIAAAKALLPFTEPRPASIPTPQCTIVIPPLPNDHGSVAQDPEGGVGISQSFPLSASNSRQPLSEPPGTPNIEETTFDHPPIDYSIPPTPAELAEIKAAIDALRPDLAHLPTPEFHLCPCGHWITGEYDCCRRELSKLN